MKPASLAAFSALLAASACTDHGDAPPCGTPGMADQVAHTTNQIVALTLAGDDVYWLDLGGVGKVSTAGTQTEIVTAPSPAAFALGGSIAVDAANAYWANGNYPAGAVTSVPTAGGSPAQLATANEPVGVAVDAQNLYFSTFGSSASPVGTIVEQPLAGGPAITLATGLATVGPIAIDASNVYWTDRFGAVSAVQIGGGSMRTLVPAQYTLPANTILDDYPVAIAVDAGVVYWTSEPLDPSQPATIESVAGAGGATTTIATLSSAPRGLAVDADYVYWSDLGPSSPGSGLGAPPHLLGGSVSRVAKAGSDVEVLATGAIFPVGPVVGDNVFYYASGASDGTVFRVVM
jgi:hypothetical protein